MPTIYDDDLVDFLKWALPRMGYRWVGFKKVRGQVKSRISDRLDELGLDGLDDYRELLEDDPDEWDRLDSFCRITISRFYRDRNTWNDLRSRVLPSLADRARRQNRDGLRAWSIGCASGEEPYTLRLCWELGDQRPWAGLELEIEAIDAAPHMIERARRGRYPKGNLKELPDDWIERAFSEEDGEFRLRDEFRRGVDLEVADFRDVEPSGAFDLVLCRNLAFMYFDEAGRRRALERLAEATEPGAALVVGNRAKVPDDRELFELWPDAQYVWRRVECSTS